MQAVFLPKIPVVDSETGEVVELFDTALEAQGTMDGWNREAAKEGKAGYHFGVVVA